MSGDGDIPDIAQIRPLQSEDRKRLVGLAL
jgi:hypothetical protein